MGAPFSVWHSPIDGGFAIDFKGEINIYNEVVINGPSKANVDRDFGMMLTGRAGKIKNVVDRLTKKTRAYIDVEY